MSTRLEAILARFRDTESSKQNGRVNLTALDIMFICERAEKVLFEDPMVLRIDAPICVVGDLH